MVELSYIIPIFKPDKYRLASLKYHTEVFLAKQKGVDFEVIVMEQDCAKHPVFNKQWLCNRGVRKAKAPMVAIADVDVYCNHAEYLSVCMKKDRESRLQWFFGWDRLIYESNTQIRSSIRDDYPYPGVQEGGIVFFRKELWGDMGGANEYIKALNGPDNDIAMRAYYVTRTYDQVGVTLNHRWHPKSTEKGPYKKLNKGILKYTRHNPDEVINLLKQHKWGAAAGPYSEKQSFYQARTSGVK